ncbi:uncharacterized protein BCR38DRAFT_46840 [Pseudomassariella vexata]|uniref:1-phosphatidylinositol-4-phosphate 5-kinase n=1 Tax=Pseudomassariella vexata TaxID=1141098 RepID=A0A1Y2DNP9_9PEZI|nr:uncharacterized protein BCR38DRAFT_46840 [Pseudomassariella vexata]ORY60799.1 hypothetical protein BCR38DRAFT_46840 [Pseudomassariella vexata]
MPSFVNDENSPVYAHNGSVVHLSSPRHFYGGPVKDNVAGLPRKTFIDEHPHHIDANELTESLDEYDNSSSHSSDTSDPRARLNGDNASLNANSMTPLPNGARPSKGSNFSHNNGNGFSPENMQNGHTGSNGRLSQPHIPMVNGVASPHPPSSISQYQPQHQNQPETQSKRISADSAARTSLQQTPVDGSLPRPFQNSDRTPRASNDTMGPTASRNSAASAPPEPQRKSPSPQRFSPPPHPSASTSALQPPTGGLKQRHTLEVPKPQSGRGSRDGTDAAYASGRFSPTAGPSGRRASLSLARRNTRSLHSDMPRDEIVPDDDALRWAEAYRQKRAKKKRREDFEADDKVLVGTKVDENHANWTTAYNMLTGIRVSVSRTNAKIDRPLTDADFEAKQKSTFDIAGNELVPSAKYDFKFKDYAPWVFRHLRALFRLDPADYLMSLTGKYILSELGSPGKSGSFFYFSRDYKYIIKTIHHAEHKFLRKILKEYYNHVTDNPNTLLSQFYGLHRVKMPYGKKIHFVVMNNLFPPHRDIHQTFDLKGSTVGRDYSEEDLEKNPRATLKDLNWLRRKRHLELGIQKKKAFMEQLQRDVKLMQKLKIMDYSLLVGIHDVQKGNEENLRDKTLQVFNPGGDGPDGEDFDPHSVLMRTPSKLESARKARELRQMIKSERPIPMAQTSSRMPEVLEEGHVRGGLFWNEDGGLRATHEDNTPGQELYYLGVIDCLTHYGVIKKLEHFWKGLSSDKTQISALPPQEYGDRFLEFMAGVTMSAEEAARDEQDRQAAAAAVAAEEAANEAQDQEPVTSAPPAPTYLPPAPPDMRSAGSPEPNPTVEKATRKALKREKDVAKEDEVPERKISTTASAAVNAPGKGSTHTVLPVVEEAVEAASEGGRSWRDNGSGGRPFTPSLLETHGTTTRSDGFTDLGPHGIGGRGPPTPPKSSYLGSMPGFEGNRRRSDSGSNASIGQGVNSRISRESLDKALPPLPLSNR